VHSLGTVGERLAISQRASQLVEEWTSAGGIAFLTARGQPHERATHRLEFHDPLLDVSKLRESALADALAGHPSRDPQRKEIPDLGKGETECRGAPDKGKTTN